MPDHEPDSAVPDQHRFADGLPIAGEILLSHIRSIDIRARPIRAVGVKVPAETARLASAKLAALIAI